MRILIIILSILPFFIVSMPGIYAQVIDTPSDNITDNTTDNDTDNDTDNETIDNETVIRLKNLFASVHDNYSCVNPGDPVRLPFGTRLESCIRENVSNNRWPIICKEAEQIISLRCNDPYITSLEGLQQFPNLETLSFGLKGTSISDLAPIRNIRTLKYLAVPNSNITEIGFLVRMKKLGTLDLKGNSVTDLTFLPYIPSIETLSLEYQGPNYISDITNIGYLKKLNKLSLQGNKVTDISPLSNLHNLAYLSIRDNRVSSLEPLRYLSMMSGLNFSINMISDLSPLDNLTRLTVIIGNSNRISDLSPLDNLTDIRDIEFKGNTISDINPLEKMKRIRRIGLDFNIIKDISILSKLTIVTDINELGLSYNCIPKENYRAVDYIDEIGLLRLDHQCENYPPEGIYPDNSTIVNSDLVNAQDVIDDNQTMTKFQSTAGGGCSIRDTNNQIDIFALLALVVIIARIISRDKIYPRP